MSFLKVKRKNEEEPKEVYILASKKSKMDQFPVFELLNSFVEGKDVDSVIDSSIKNRSSIKTRTFNIDKLRTKLREDNAERARESKLKVLNHVRKLDDSSKEESLPVIDVEDESETDENSSKYVYDLYYSGTSIDMSSPDAIGDYCLRELKEEIFAENESEEEMYEDDDSNDENHWANDYPDESSGSDGSAEDLDDYISKKMKDAHLNSDYSLSSDEYDEEIERDFYSGKLELESKIVNYYDEVASDSESD